jgi:hypothetical protein
MPQQPERHFDSIESALEFLSLLEETIADAEKEVRQLTENSPRDRRQDAFRLALFKLNQLSSHVARSHRLVNDLRILRRLLFHERVSPAE